MYPELQSHEFKFNPEFLSNFPTSQNFEDGILENYGLIDQSTQFNDFSETCISTDSLDVPDFSDACIKFLSDILEEDLDEIPSTLQDFKALQATEKSLYDVLGEEYSPFDDLTSSFDQRVENPDVNFDGIWGINHGVEGKFDLVLNQTPLETFVSLNDDVSELNSGYSRSINGDYSNNGVASSSDSILPHVSSKKGDRVVSVSKVRRRKNSRRDDGINEGRRGNKQQASSNEDYVEMKEYDDIILGKDEKDEYQQQQSSIISLQIGVGLEEKDDLSNHGVESSVNEIRKDSRGRKKGGKKQNNEIEEVDLRTILTQCAQVVSSFDLRGANERLRQIRQHSSPYGDSIQRLAHYFANALEARLAGTGSTVSSNIVDARISSLDFLKAYRVYVSAIPCKRLSYFLANNTIMKLVEKSTRIHIIDFGVFLGLQWPCFIQNLSKGPNCPPKLRITGIDYPQQGFRPAERVEATGRRLAGYCERFKVPFEYQAIAKKWESITMEDLKLKDDEIVIVNCMYRSGTLLDETVDVDDHKDAFLRLIKRVNPALFIHGVANGSYNAPFFITRFREALFHFSSLFDIFQETRPRDDHERVLIESEVYGKEVLNVVACEGIERIHRPETYKQWQARSARVGLKQVPLDRELLGRAKAKLKANYHKDYVVEEDQHWMLQGWKGRTLFGLSIWQPC